MHKNTIPIKIMKEINTIIDHTMLKATTTAADITQLCNEANEHKFAAVCVPPFYVDQAARETDTDVAVCTVVGFPLGFEPMVTKIATIKKAVEEGADELDMVVNIAALKNGDWDYVHNEIDKLTTITKLKYSKTIKIIFETAYLTTKEITKLCNICNECSVDYAKTSTGYAPKGAVIDTVKLMRTLLDDKIKIKASGGISTLDSAKAMVAAGADRIGASKSIQIIS